MKKIYLLFAMLYACTMFLSANNFTDEGEVKKYRK